VTVCQLKKHTSFSIDTRADDYVLNGAFYQLTEISLLTVTSHWRWLCKDAAQFTGDLLTAKQLQLNRQLLSIF
jgi:hypothetical protein